MHGGAGALPSAEEAPDYEPEARRGIEGALAAGARPLGDGAPALEAVVAAVCVLEDCEVFNAGRGSVLASDGRVEMDAAVMVGGGRRAGAVIGVRRVRQPVRAARAVLEDGRHVALAGEGAERFAAACGLELADPEHFVTARRRAQLARALAGTPPGGGTVGAVARDARGGLAAATSTGGIAGKRPGRVSDSGLIGAGTWADDASCAVSATGHGEAFVRCAFAHEVDALLRLAGLDLESACRRALDRVAEGGGSGGCIAVDPSGRPALPYDTPRMARGWLGPDGRPHFAL